MAERAPTYPTTNELEVLHPRRRDCRERLLERRAKVSDAMGGAGLLAVIGPCAMTEAEAIIRVEAARLAEVSEGNNDIEALYRMPFWKPRTRKEDWHGLETTNPELAYRLMVEGANRAANIAVEIGTDPRHLSRYADATTLAWKGGRNDDQAELMYALAVHDTTLPVAVKNGLDGDILKAMQDVERIEELRHGIGARAIVLFRGGFNAKSPEAWEDTYLAAHDLTGGRLLVDWAHGGEQAHDPEGKFGKSVEGQIACMEHTIAIAEQTGKVPAGVFAEASSAKSPTDPVMPFETAIDGAQRLARIKQSLSLGV